MNHSEIDYLQFWFAAKEQEMGLYLEVNNPSTFKQALYKAREESGELSLTQIICFAPAKPGVLMLVKQSVELDP